MSTANTWTAEDSKRLREVTEDLRERAARKKAQEIVRFNADLTIGSLLVPAFNSVVNMYGQRGLNVTWLAFYNEGTHVRYLGFDVTGRRDLMNEFYAWYRGFFRI